MTTFNGQSCVLGTAESCGLRLEECGALGFVLTLIGQEMGSMLACCGLAWRVAAVASSLVGAAGRTGWQRQPSRTATVRMQAANANFLPTKKVKELAVCETLAC